MRTLAVVHWLPPLLVLAALAGCSTNAPVPPQPTEDERQALAVYEGFWSVTTAAFAEPGERDWTPRLQEVATGQALDSVRRDVENYASVPAHTEGSVKRAPKVTSSATGHVEIEDCVDLADSRLVSDDGGQVLDDLANRVPRYVYRAGIVNQNGRWLVDRTAPALDQPC